MRAQQTREKNPYGKPTAEPKVSAPWGDREGYELGYQRTYGEYGSNARGWNDKPHARNWAHRDNSTETYPDYSGVGPKNYRRSDESILEHIASMLTWSPDVDASELTIAVKDGNVIIAGTVPDRSMIYLVDDLMDEVHGVQNFDNHVKLAKNTP